MSKILAAVDAVRSFCPLGPGMVADDSATDPFKVLPNRLYVWPRRLVPQRTNDEPGVAGGLARWDEADLRVRVLYVIASKGETRVKRADRAVSETLDAALDLITAAVEAHRRYSPLWWDAYVDNVVPDAVHSYEVRGVGVDLVLRMIPGADRSDSGGAS